LEIRTFPAVAKKELVSAAMTFRSSNGRRIKKIIGEIENLCGLRQPLRTGKWIWRQTNGIPNAETKRFTDFIDGGPVQWSELSEWNGVPLVGGSATTWNGVLLSLEIIVGKEYCGDILEILAPVSNDSGFSLDVDADADKTSRVVKLAVFDNFLFNFSSLWE
jgi:hypothetical protein